MDEGKGVGMKRQSSDRVCRCTVFAVSCDRVADPLRVDAYLVLASGLKFEFDFSVGLAIDCSLLYPAAVG